MTPSSNQIKGQYETIRKSEIKTHEIAKTSLRFKPHSNRVIMQIFSENGGGMKPIIYDFHIMTF